jgi:hypothetical protein
MSYRRTQYGHRIKPQRAQRQEEHNPETLIPQARYDRDEDDRADLREYQNARARNDDEC